MDVSASTNQALRRRCGGCWRSMLAPEVGWRRMAKAFSLVCSEYWWDFPAVARTLAGVLVAGRHPEAAATATMDEVAAAGSCSPCGECPWCDRRALSLTHS